MKEPNDFLKDNLNVMELFQDRKLVKICAPMVRYSKLQFRNLVRHYNCDLCFTPMIMADSFCKSAKARNNEFTTHMDDQPLITQFAANTVHDFVGAAYMVAPFCNGVDLNCGCPQRWAKQQNLGAVLLENPQLIYDIVRECRNLITKPFTVSVKMRLHKEQKKNIEISRQLEHCGVSFLTIHGRTFKENNGPIDTHTIKLIVENVKIPVVANGNVKTLNDCFLLQNSTNCKGVMVANGILTNPALFTGNLSTPLECIQEWINICLPQLSNITFQCFHHHLVFMLEKILTRAQKRIFNNLQTVSDVLDFIKKTFSIEFFLNKKCIKQIEIDYKDRDEMYSKLKPNEILEDSNFIFNYQSNGKFFNSKTVDYENCDWSNIFIENG